MKALEVKAASVEEAIEKGLGQLGKGRDEVEIEIIDKGGIIKKAKVLLTVKEASTAKSRAQDFLSGLFSHMDIDVSAEIEEDEEKVSINISGEDSGTVIGYRGDVLDAVQYLTSLSVNSGDDYKKVIIDCENYREKRSETLKSLAEKLAAKAERTGRKVVLEPMNPFERRIIHSALHDMNEVTTESEGVEPNRYIVITPKNLRPGGDSRYDSRPQRGGGREGGGGRDNRGGSEGGGRGYNNRGRDSGKDSGRDRDFGGRGSSKKSSSFSSFGTYLGNARSGFSQDTDFTKKSGFDNLKD